MESGSVLKVQRGSFTSDVLGSRPTSANIPGSLKNNSAITITSKSGPRPGFHRIISRPNVSQNKIIKTMVPGQKIAEIRNRLGEMRSYSGMRPRYHGPGGKLLRPPGLPESVSITKITNDPKKADGNKMELDSEPETQILDSDDDDANSNAGNKGENNKKLNHKSEGSKSSINPNDNKVEETKHQSGLIVFTTDEKLPSEEALDNKSTEKKSELTNIRDTNKIQSPHNDLEVQHVDDAVKMQLLDSEREGCEKKINLLKNYRHQRIGGRLLTESSLSQLERTASVLNKEGLPDFRKNLDDITQSYSPSTEEKLGTKSRKKRSPNKDSPESQVNDKQASSMSHSVSILLGNSSSKPVLSEKSALNTVPVVPIGQSPSPMIVPGMLHDMRPVSHPHMAGKPGPMMSPSSPRIIEVSKPHPTTVPGAMPMSPMPAGPGYPAGPPPPEAQYCQYPPGYRIGYGGYPNTPYYGGYGGAPYYPSYGAPTAPAPYPPAAPAPTPSPEGYLPPKPQW